MVIQERPKQSPGDWVGNLHAILFLHAKCGAAAQAGGTDIKYGRD
jgi:hypothetical protein